MWGKPHDALAQNKSNTAERPSVLGAAFVVPIFHRHTMLELGSRVRPFSPYSGVPLSHIL